MKRLFYATHHVSGYTETQVVIFDDADPVEAGLIESGYFKEIKEPERADALQGADRP